MRLFVIQRGRLITRTVLVVALTVAYMNSCMAQSSELTPHDPSAPENDSAAEASKQAANPLANLWLMLIQQNNNWVGMPANKGNRVQSNLQFQPLMSVNVNDDWSLITRPVIQTFTSTPFLNQAGQEKRVTAFGDTVLAFALSPSRNLVGICWLAAGPSLFSPTATNTLLGQNTWQVGPAAAVGYQGKNFITYVFPQQWFSVGGDGRKTSQLLLYYAFVHVYSNGWSLGTNPSMSVDWEASRGNKLAFPVGFQGGKLRTLWPLPVKL